MRKGEIKNAFSEIKKLSCIDEKLTNSIKNRLNDAENTVIPINGLKTISMYFVAYMAIGLVIFLLASSLSSYQAANMSPEIAIENTLDMISANSNAFFNSYNWVNSFINGIFSLFFKISILAFVFAAASMNAESSETTKGELSCVN